MKKILFPFLIFSIFFASCLKNDKCTFNDSTTVAPQSEIDNLRDSLNAHGISATLSPIGFYYNIS
ncbi:MAG: hypothetical protein ACMG51_08115, partial [Ginsengibacter sp.]